MNKYPYQYKTPEQVFAASEKRMEKWHEDLKAAIIASLDVVDPSQLCPIYATVRRACRGESLYKTVFQNQKEEA